MRRFVVNESIFLCFYLIEYSFLEILTMQSIIFADNESYFNSNNTFIRNVQVNVVEIAGNLIFILVMILTGCLCAKFRKIEEISYKTKNKFRYQTIRSLLGLLCAFIWSLNIYENVIAYVQSIALLEQPLYLYGSLTSSLATMGILKSYGLFEEHNRIGLIILPVLLRIFHCCILSLYIYDYLFIIGVSLDSVIVSLHILNVAVMSILICLDMFTLSQWVFFGRKTHMAQFFNQTAATDKKRPNASPTPVNPSSNCDDEAEKEDECHPILFTDTESETEPGLRYDHEGRSFYSKCSFWWFGTILKKGWKKPLEFSDIDNLHEKEKSQYQYERFDSISKKTSLWHCFYLTYWRKLLLGGLFKLAGDLANVVGPLVILPIVNFVKDCQEGSHSQDGSFIEGRYYLQWSEFIQNGWVLCWLALVASLLQSTFSQASTHHMTMEGVHVRTALQVLIYKKSLKIAIWASKDKENDRKISSLEKDEGGGALQSSSDVARVINLTSEDSENILNFFIHCHYLWAIPLKVFFLLGLLYLQLGVAALYAALTTVALLVPIQFILAKGIASTAKTLMTVSDERLRRTEELFSLIRTIRVNVWEKMFLNRISDSRKVELALLLKDGLLRALMTFLTQAFGILIILLAFLLYALLEEVPLDVGKVFSSLALFSQLTVPLFILPSIVATTIKAARSIKRLEKYFEEDEVISTRTLESSKMAKNNTRNGQISTKEPKNNSKIIVSIKNATFTLHQSTKKSALININTHIESGKLTMVVGGIGCGKTSFLLSILGEMKLTAGEVTWRRNASVAYVPENPWLLNCTLKENILLGKAFLLKRYQKVIQACALKEDFEALPLGDETEIGERGFNLSGGQRQRIAIARALYSDALMVILDSPLSALDYSVSQKVFNDAILGLLIKKKRTVVLATNHFQLTKAADKIIFIKQSTIALQGPPEYIKREDPGLWNSWMSSSFTNVEGFNTKGLPRQISFNQSQYWTDVKYSTNKSRSSERRIYGSHNDESEIMRRQDPFKRSFFGHSPFQGLLPGIEMEGLHSETFYRRRVSKAPKASLFRTTSTEECRTTRDPFDRRVTKSLPPQPRRRSAAARTPKSRKSDSNSIKNILNNSRRKKSLKASFHNASKKKLSFQRMFSFHSEKSQTEDDEENVSLDEFGSEFDIYGRSIDHEQREKGKISKWNYVSYFKAFGWGVASSYFFFSVANQGIAVALDIWLGDWSEKSAAENNSYSLNSSFDNSTLNIHVQYSMNYYLMVYSWLSISAVLVNFLTIFFAQFGAHRARTLLHHEMVASLLNAKIKFFEQNPLGRILNRFSSDMAMIDKELGWALMHLVFFVLLCGSAILVNIILSPIFIVITLPICGCYYFIQHLFRCSSRELKRMESLSLSPVFGLVTETLSSPIVIRAYGLQNRFLSCYFHRLNQYLSFSLLLHAGNRWLGISLDYLGGVIVYLATMASLIASTTNFGIFSLTPSHVGLAIKYTLTIPVYLNWLVRFLSDTEMCLNSVERIRQYIHLSPEGQFQEDEAGIVGETEKGLKKKSSKSSTFSSLRTDSILTFDMPFQGTIEFNRVDIFYDKSEAPIVHDVSFRVENGEKVGICGRTGSGKSSLHMAILRLVDDYTGSISIDGCDIKKYSLSTLRNGISVLLQEGQIFQDTIRNNLDPFNTFGDDKIWNALKYTKLTDFILTLPEGLETQLGGKGIALSSGHCQLLGIARVILEEKTLILLDEATSYLDAQTERSVMDSLHKILPKSTILSVTHSVGNILSHERVLVMDNGSLVEDGPPSQLKRKKDSKFSQLIIDRTDGHKLFKDLQQ